MELFRDDFSGDGMVGRWRLEIGDWRLEMDLGVGWIWRLADEVGRLVG